MSATGQSRLKRGHVREDGMVFWQYNGKRSGDERWVTHDKYVEMVSVARQNNKRSYDKNREARVAQSRAYHAKNKERGVDRRLKKSFGISLAEYEALEGLQGGACAICKEPESVIRFGRPARMAVDHCHTSKLVRGLLCASCNIAIGHLKDNPFLARSAADYLEQSQMKITAAFQPRK